MRAGSGTPYLRQCAGIEVARPARRRIARTCERGDRDRVDRAVLAADDRQVLVDRVVERGLLHESRARKPPGSCRRSTTCRAAWGRHSGIVRLDPARRKRAEGVVVVLQGQAELLEVVGALGAAGGFARGLNGGKEEGDQEGDDRDRDEELDEGESRPLASRPWKPHRVCPSMAGQLDGLDVALVRRGN